MRIRSTIAVAATLAAFLLGHAGTAQAQGMNRGGGNSAFGVTGGGMSSSSLNSGMGGSSSGAFGTRSMGSSLSAGGNTFGGSNMQNTQMGNLGQAGFGQQGGMGQNGRRQGQFIGTDSADIGNLFGGMLGLQGNRTNRGMQGLQTGGRNNRQNQEFRNDNGGQGQQGRQTQLRVSVKAAFDAPVQTAQTRALDATSIRVQRMATSGRLAVVQPVEVTAQGSTVVLRGEVATQHDRDLVERLVRLEPGVKQIQNEIALSGQQSSPAPAPANSLNPLQTDEK